jgi:hypothetical protein
MQYDIHKPKGTRVATSSVAQTIEHFCQEKNIPISKIDFDFLGVKTEAFSALDDEKPQILSLPLDNSVWLNEKLSIRQTYEIFLRFAHPEADEIVLNLGFGGNKSLTSVVAFIKPSSKFGTFDGLEGKLERELNKRKLKMGVLIGIHDDGMKRDIASFCEFIRKTKKLTNEFKIELFHGPDFVPSRDDSLEFVYQRHIDGVGQSGVVSTKAGSELVVYQKARMGVLSRDAKGRLLEPSEPKTTKSCDFKIGDGVDLIDSENEKIYRAKKTGFVIFNGMELDVKEEMALHEVSIKTGSIDAGMDSDSKLDITDDNPNSEAIGDNMSVRAAVVNVQGSVGVNATVIAKDVNIGGQTHKTSKITATKAHIENHKGYIEADEVVIDTLEGGEVVAKKATIGTAIGGKIKADECHIKILGSNNTVNATRLIEIETPQGGENRLSIEAAANASDMKALNELEEKISHLQKSVSEKEEFVTKELRDIEAQTKTTAEIKVKIEEERKKNSPLANVLLAKLKHFAQNVEKVKKIESGLVEEKEALKALLGEADLLQYKVLDAKVIALSPWQGYNSVSFRLIFPPREFNYKIAEGATTKEIILKKISDADYEVFAI